MLLLLACNLGGQKEDTTEPPGGSISPNEEAAEQLKQNFYQALQEATPNHESQLRITNEEITSLVQIELVDTGQLPIRQPQIWFTAGNIYMSGRVRALGIFTFNSIIVATAIVEDGLLVVEVKEARMGPFGFPNALLQSITETINETLVGILIDADLEITRVEILEGEMFVLGRRGTASPP